MTLTSMQTVQQIKLSHTTRFSVVMVMLLHNHCYRQGRLSKRSAVYLNDFDGWNSTRPERDEIER